MKDYSNRVGERVVNKEGYEMLIVEYNNSLDVVIEFQDEYKHKTHVQYWNFKKGTPRNPYHKSVYGVGMLGIMSDGSKPCTSYGNSKDTREYIMWKNMILRCYDEKVQEEHPTYKGVTICKRWLIFANFLEDIKSLKGYDKWVNDNTYELDKDLLQQNVPNNEKVYSPETCCFIPRRDNSNECNVRTKSIKVIGENVKTSEKTRVFESTMDAERELGINHSNISKCCSGDKKYKTAGGYKWSYVEK